jgi:hypothetical protein
MNPTDEQISPSSVGERLKGARSHKGIDLGAAAQATRIRTIYLEAFEADRWDEFPAEIYLLGFLKKYAQFLGLSPQEMVELYKQQRGQASDERTASPSFMEPEKGGEKLFGTRPFIAAGIILLSLILLLVLGSHHNRNLLSSSNRFGGGSAPPEHVLSVTALQDAWFSVSSDGRRVFEGTIPAASIRTWRSPFSFLIEVRKATDVRVEADGAPVNLAGRESRRIRLPSPP